MCWRVRARTKTAPDVVFGWYHEYSQRWPEANDVYVSTHTHTHTYIVSLTHSLTLSHTNTHTHTHTQTHTHIPQISPLERVAGEGKKKRLLLYLRRPCVFLSVSTLQ